MLTDMCLIAEALLKALKSNSRRVPTLVFCNRSSTAGFVGHFLNDNGISNIVLHAQMPQKVNGVMEETVIRLPSWIINPGEMM